MAFLLYSFVVLLSHKKYPPCLFHVLLSARVDCSSLKSTNAGNRLNSRFVDLTSLSNLNRLGTDPHARWCGIEGSRETSLYPDFPLSSRCWPEKSLASS